MSNKLYTGAEIILKSLEAEKVDLVFGYPGGSVLPLYDALYKNENIIHILTRHEQGAGHAADGYARATGKPGVVFATSGPGATNLVTAIATAHMDSIPMVVITGQVARRYLGRQAFQEADIVDIVAPITKYATLVKNVDDLAEEIKKAFRIANSGRKGPVLLDVPKDVTVDKAQFIYPLDIPYRGERFGESEGRYGQVINFFKSSKRPLLLVGGGAKEATDEVKELAEMIKCPLVYTLMGKGILDEDHPLNIGMLGMHGTGPANYAISHCDMIFAIGTRFNDRATGDEAQFAKGARIVHLDIDKKEFNKNIRDNLSLHDDSAIGLFKLLKVMRKENFDIQYNWIDQIADWQMNHPLSYSDDSDLIKPQEVVETINKVTERKAYLTTEVGQHQMWAAQYFKPEDPHHFITSGGLGTMGFGLPASIGVQFGKPKSLVVAIAGDGSIQMNIQELMTIRENNLPIKIVIVNNRCLGMVRQWQQLFFGERYSHTLFQHEASQPDFVRLAESYGIDGYRVSDRELLESTLQMAFEEPGPKLIEVIVDPNENVYPMVPSGAGNEDMLFND